MVKVVDEGIDLKLILNANPAYVRRDPGDLTSLMKSIRTHGPQIPILTTPSYLLVDGYRRLVVAQKLGWTRYPAVSTDDWWKIKDHMLKTRELENKGWPFEPMRWLEINELVRGIYADLYHPIRFRGHKARRNERSGQRANSFRNAFVMNDVAPMLGLEISTVLGIRSLGSTVIAAEKRSPALRAAVIKAINDEEEMSGRLWAALRSARATLDKGLFVPTATNVKAAQDQASRIEAGLAILERVALEFDSIKPINPAMPLETAQELLRRITTVRRRMTSSALRMYVNAQSTSPDLDDDAADQPTNQGDN